MYFRRFASAFGAGSVATTLRPRARYRAAQLAPITPVPTIATFLISRLFVVAIRSSNKFDSMQSLLLRTVNWPGLPFPRSYLVASSGWRRWYADRRFRRL